IFAFTCLLALTLYSACDGNKKEKKEEPAVTVSSEGEHAGAQADNEVKCEAPDAQKKSKQGYALPKHDQQTAQSPINIISTGSEKSGVEPIAFLFHTDITGAENLGHTIQVDFKPGSTCVVNGRDYSSKQFHFHTPSEHLIDGLMFPMEMHIVNVLKDSTK